jgi:3-hydroxyanthranilate 3,4-dioxygenase
MRRKRQTSIFEDAREAGPYDDFPILPPDMEPQVHLSRNDRPQPFYLICERDTVLAQVSGEAVVAFAEGPVRYFTLEPGDHVYVPAGTPHQVRPRTESVQLRYKAKAPGLEGVAWYCPTCGAEVAREEWDTAEELPQDAYWRISQAFNADPARRQCSRCGTEHPPADLTSNRWPETAAAIRAATAEPPAASAVAPAPAH